MLASTPSRAADLEVELIAGETMVQLAANGGGQEHFLRLAVRQLTRGEVVMQSESSD